jgi:toxin HigB-1
MAQCLPRVLIPFPEEDFITMIKSFLHKGLNDFFYDGTKKGIQPKHAGKLELILDHLNAASDISDMNYPGSGLHKLEPKSTDMEKQVWAVTVSGNWRVTFKFFDGDAYIVDYKDYH